MLSDDFGKFKATLQKIFALYDKPLSDVVLSVWWSALEPYAIQDVTRALTAHIRNPDSGQYLPKPADVIKGLTGGIANGASLAWSKVDSAVRRRGPYSSVVFDDPVIHKVIADMGGWQRMCSKTDAEWPFVQKEFETRYRGAATTGGAAEYPAKLLGIADAENARTGVRIADELRNKTSPVALIGDAARAAQVAQTGSTGPLVKITNGGNYENESERGSGPLRIGQGAPVVRS